MIVLHLNTIIVSVQYVRLLSHLYELELFIRLFIFIRHLCFNQTPKKCDASVIQQVLIKALQMIQVKLQYIIGRYTQKLSIFN